MTEPQSIKTEPYCDFPRQSYSFVTDDFCHEKNFVAKFTAKTARSVLKIKEAVSQKKDSWSVADEVKLWFDLPNNRSIYTKIKSSDYIKIHYDHGIRQYSGKKYYLYGGMTSGKDLKNVSLKVGGGNVSEHCNSDNRIKLTLKSGGDNLWHWYNRTTVTEGKVTFGLLSVFDITNKVFQKNNILLGYRPNLNTDVFLRAEVAGFRKQNFNIQQPKTIFDSVTADVVTRIDDKSKLALEAKYDIRDNSLASAVLVYQKEYKPKEFVKVSVNKELDIAVLHKRPIYNHEHLGSLSIGASFRGLKDRNISFQHGIELAVNL